MIFNHPDIYDAKNQYTNGLLPNPFGQTMQALCLNQIEGFQPAQRFVDSSNTAWELIKAASDSRIDIPDPKTVQIVDYWCHEFPGLKTKIYLYVVEGIRQPRVETEKPTRVMYHWFSPLFVTMFTPQMITQKEWLKANVYVAEVEDTRISKLKGLCRLQDVPQPSNGSEEALLKVEGISNESA